MLSEQWAKRYAAGFLILFDPHESSLAVSPANVFALYCYNVSVGAYHELFMLSQGCLPVSYGFLIAVPQKNGKEWA